MELTNTQAAVIDFGTSKIVTIIAKSKTSDRSEIIGTGSVLYDGFRDGDWNTPEKLVDSVKNSISAAELQARQHIHEIYVGVPGEYCKLLTIETEIDLTQGDVALEDTNALMDTAAEQLHLLDEDGIILHRVPAWYKVDGGAAGPDPYGQQGKKLSGLITFVLGDRQFMNDIAEVMGLLNITVAGFFSSTLGTAQLMISMAERDHTAVMIDMGYLNTEISVIHSDALIHHEIMDRGASELSVALVEELNISLKDAERIKRAFSFRNSEEDETEEYIEVRNPYTGRKESIRYSFVADILTQTMNDLTDEIRDRMEKNVFEHINQRSKVYLTGGGIAMMKGGRTVLSEKLQMPVEGMLSKTSKLNYPMFSTALGLNSIVLDAIQASEPAKEKQKGNFLSGLTKKIKK